MSILFWIGAIVIILVLAYLRYNQMRKSGLPNQVPGMDASGSINPEIAKQQSQWLVPILPLFGLAFLLGAILQFLHGTLSATLLGICFLLYGGTSFLVAFDLRASTKWRYSMLNTVLGTGFFFGGFIFLAAYILTSQAGSVINMRDVIWVIGIVAVLVVGMLYYSRKPKQ